MTVNLKNGRANVNEIVDRLAQEHPCNVRQLAGLLVNGLEEAYDEIERLQGEVKKATMLALGIAIDSAVAGGVRHSGQNKWHDYEVPTLHDPVVGVPASVRFLVDDNDIHWVRIGTQNRWKDADWDSQTLKEDGYITLEEILSEHATWVQAEPDGDRHEPVRFDHRDDRPDPESFPVFRTPNLSQELMFHWHFESETFHCMNEGEGQALAVQVFGTATPDWYTLVQSTLLEEVPV